MKLISSLICCLYFIVSAKAKVGIYQANGFVYIVDLGDNNKLDATDEGCRVSIADYNALYKFDTDKKSSLTNPNGDILMATLTQTPDTVAANLLTKITDNCHINVSFTDSEANKRLRLV